MRATIARPLVSVATVLVLASGCGSSDTERDRGSRDDPQSDPPAEVTPADDLPPPEEPWLADEGDWEADFNEAQIACYQGSMSACDAIWLDDRILMDTWLYEYGFLCGGRIRTDVGDAMVLRRREYGSALCVEIFPGHD